MSKKIIFSFLLGMVLLSPAWARPGRIDEATIKMREEILSRTRFVEVQRVRGDHEGGYEILATAELDETGSRDLIAQFRRLPFERVTYGQCHEPGFALRFLDSDKKEVATISLCWDCRNLQAASQTPAEFREYREDFAAKSKRGLSFQRRSIASWHPKRLSKRNGDCGFHRRMSSFPTSAESYPANLAMN